MNKFLSLLIVITPFLSNKLFSQLGGKHVYEFLRLPQSGRVSGLGTASLTTDFDPNNQSINPALLTNKCSESLFFNYNYFFADIQHGSFGFAKTVDKWKLNTYIGFNFIDYGTQKRTNEFDQDLGTFAAKERAVVLGASKMLNERMQIGVDIKPVFSTFDSYQSFGLVGDVGLTYANEAKNWLLSFAFKNIGGELSNTVGPNRSAPFDVQIGYTKKLSHLPFQFTILAHQLQQWSQTYDNPNNVETDLFGNVKTTSGFSKTVDNFFRHLIFSGEFAFGKNKNLMIRGAYNHQRRKELSISNFRSLSGFSLGFGLKLNRFRIDYGIGYHHIAGGTNNLSIQTNLSSFRKGVR